MDSAQCRSRRCIQIPVTLNGRRTTCTVAACTDRPQSFLGRRERRASSGLVYHLSHTPQAGLLPAPEQPCVPKHAHLPATLTIQIEESEPTSRHVVLSPHVSRIAARYTGSVACDIAKDRSCRSPPSLPPSCSTASPAPARAAQELSDGLSSDARPWRHFVLFIRLGCNVEGGAFPPVSQENRNSGIMLEQRCGVASPSS
jgi:hypothetical protein